MNLSKEKFLIKRHSERSHAVAKSKNLGRCVIASLVRGAAISCLLFLAACGDDPKVGGTEEDAGIIAIENKTVSGVSQKGPFVNGSSVKLYEMDGETLAPTGKSFPGKIASDDGRFTVPSISLASQYALLEANGYFRNEITGGKSNGTITLNALTDLSDREKVNINLLTHLEYERALYLVGTGVKVSEAKKQAESEILDAFEIKGEFENSEDLDIFSSGDGNAALLAFSVLMLGNLTEADLTERLTNFATDVEQDGKWDDEKTKAIIADWASAKSLEGGLATIRNNIASWGLSNGVPDFEKYVNNFWWQNYKLGVCNSDREGENKKNSNVLSKNKDELFTCVDGTWIVPSVYISDTYNWTSGNDGESRYGELFQSHGSIFWTNNENALASLNYGCYFAESDSCGKFCYVYENNDWRKGNYYDCSLGLGGCTSARQNTIGQGKNKKWYICDSGKWRDAKDIEKDTATWGAGKFNGEVRVGQTNATIYYIFETTHNVWRNATVQEYDTYDYVNNSDWANGVDGELRKGSVTDAVYVFDATAWRVAGDIEKMLGGCVTAIQDSVGKVNNSYYICKLNAWVKAATIEYDTYHWIAGRDGEIKSGNVTKTEKYKYDEKVGLWNYADDIDALLNNGCTKKREGATDTDGNENRYYCTANGWVSLMDWSWDVPKEVRFNTTITYGFITETAERGGQTYRTVTIGVGDGIQTWMAENLNYYDATLDGRSWCYGAENSATTSNCAVTGRLYTWVAAVGKTEEECGDGKNCNLGEGIIQGICPNGWHLPSYAEWNTLLTNVGGPNNIAKALKSQTGWHNGGNGTDAFGFSALPAGYRDNGGNFHDDGNDANFWSSTKWSNDNAYSMNLLYDGNDAYLGDAINYFGFSIRCVKDDYTL